MTDLFDYDVFLSFATADEAIVKPIWQELSSNGLRVFWSDASLKKEVGNSWIEVIENALERSRHMILVCSANSISSKWVQREYRAFYDHCYSPTSRRLIPVLAHGFKPNDLPLFLRDLQVTKLEEQAAIQSIVPLLGGIDIDALRKENDALKRELDALRRSVVELESHEPDRAGQLNVGYIHHAVDANEQSNPGQFLLEGDSLRDWLDQTLPWLYVDGLSSRLPRSHRQLLDMMSMAYSQNQVSNVWDLIDKLEKLADRQTDALQIGEIMINCAKVAAGLENLKSALFYFHAAEQKYWTFPHQHAVVLWMMGCVHWVMHDNVEAISAWQNTISLFEEHQVFLQANSEEWKWYATRLPRLTEALADAINTGALPTCKLSIPFEPAQLAASPTSLVQPFFEGDSLRRVSCHVSKSVPAGGFGPTGFDPNPLGFLEISEVVIEEEQYEVISQQHHLTRRNQVDITSQRRYYAACVTGTSMNAARPEPILDGDFVLIQEQSDAEHNDIVVAGILGLDSRAGVKRLQKSKGKIQLLPETTDPIHLEIDWEKEYDEHDRQIQIIGVVVAIFRRKNGK